ncbi:hypothetical protein N9L94_00210 [Robiginitalea sp.]|nr:hypothetical protein [Robiginitalea sp.]
MRFNLILLVILLLPLVGSSQQKPQLEEFLAESNPSGPLLERYVPEYTTADTERRKYLELLRSQIDTLDISASKRYKIMRDIYQGRELQWIAKYRLKTDLRMDSI